MSGAIVIAVIGAGAMGPGIAQRSAMSGFKTVLCSRSPESLERGRSRMVQGLDSMVAAGRLGQEAAEAALDLVELTTDIRAAAARADFVFEAVYEDLPLKRALFADLGRWSRPEAVLASNTSSFDINLLAEVASHPERVVGAHWFFPAQITPGLEVVASSSTSPEVVAAVIELAKAMGKLPSRCESSPGFVANRIQFAMLAEVMRIIDDGVATAEDVDRIVKSTFGFRLGSLGPCELADQAGLDVYKSIFEYLRKATGREVFDTPKVLARLASKGRLGLKSKGGFFDYSAEGAVKAALARRDRLLMERLALFERDNSPDDAAKKAADPRTGGHHGR